MYSTLVGVWGRDEIGNRRLRDWRLLVFAGFVQVTAVSIFTLPDEENNNEDDKRKEEKKIGDDL